MKRLRNALVVAICTVLLLNACADDSGTVTKVSCTTPKSVTLVCTKFKVTVKTSRGQATHRVTKKQLGTCKKGAQWPACKASIFG